MSSPSFGRARNRSTKTVHHILHKSRKYQEKPAGKGPQESEERYRSIFENALEGIFCSVPEGRFIEVNPALVRMLGYESAEEVLALKLPDDLYMDPSQRGRLQATYEAKGEVYGAELLWKKKSGEPMVVSLYARTVRDAKGNLLCYEGMVLDITEHKRMEEALRESEERYRRLVELCPDAILVHGEGKVVYVNGAGAKLLGAVGAEELLGRPIWDFVHPEYQAVVAERVRQTQEQEKPTDLLEEKLIRLDGQVIDVEVIGMAVTYQDKPATQVVFRDITGRKRMEEALRASEKRYRNLFENANDAIATVTLDGTLTSVNRGLEAILGWSREELIGQHYRKVVSPSSVALSEERTRRFLAGEKLPSIFEAELVRKDGSVVPVEARTRPIRTPEGKPISFQGIYRDITERKRAEQALRESEERYRTIFTASPDYIYLTDTEGHILDANPALRDRVGLSLEQMRQRNIKDFFAGDNHDELLQAFAQLINGQEIKGLEIRAKNSMGEIFEYEVNAIPLKEHGEVTRILSLSRDITERKRAEEALRESEARYRTVSELTSDYAYSVCVEANGNLVLEWITDAFTRIFGFTPDEIPAKGGWASLVHPDDRPLLLRRRGVLLSGQSDTSEYRLLTKGGEVRWVRDHGQAVWDEVQSRVVRIIGAGQDITERKRMEEMLRERIVQERVIPANLRKFRKELNLSQTEFGQAFGSYSQRQMNSYESGEVEVPLGLLLTIREKGYPLEAVLGSGKADAIDAVIGYLASSRKIHAMVRQLAEAILRISDQEREVINHIFHQLDPPRRRGAIEGGKILNEILRRAGISFERSEG